MYPPLIETDRHEYNRAAKVALGDVTSAVVTWHNGRLTEAAPVVSAGFDYSLPWTRDTAALALLGTGLLYPVAMRNTLLAVMEPDDPPRAGGQYWDKVAWIPAALHHARCTSDNELRQLAIDAGTHTLAELESEEFDPQFGLFRGGAFFQDGISAYPDRYVGDGSFSDIMDMPDRNAVLRAATGYGVPAMTLSTNVLYFAAYRALSEAIAADGGSYDRVRARAHSLRDSILRHFNGAAPGRLAYLIDRWGREERQEGCGWAFAVLFDLLDAPAAHALMESFHTMSAGAPALYPNYERYEQRGTIGRHCTTVWPHVQAFVALAAHRSGVPRLLVHELEALRAAVEREPIFYELYHPETGLPFAGTQEGPYQSVSCRRQTWAAQGFLAMLIHAVGGLAIERESLVLAPRFVNGIREVRLTGIWLRGARREVTIRAGESVRVQLDGRTFDIADGRSHGEMARLHRDPIRAALPSLPHSGAVVGLPWELIEGVERIVVEYPGVRE